MAERQAERGPETRREAVRSYYAGFGVREWQRLERPGDGAIEFALTTRAIARHLDPSARVLDIGGGPGRYAIWLAERGHEVVLADLSPELLEIGREHIAAAGVAERVIEVVEADACNLSRWADGSFDAALSLGPFYHLPESADRSTAAAELSRAVRADGLVFVALIPRYEFVRRTLCLADERHHLLDEAWVRRVLDDGLFDNDIPGRFSGGYGVRVEEVEPFLAAHGFAAVELFAAEGLSGGVATYITDLVEAGGETFAAALALIEETAADRSLLGSASHLLYVGRRT